MRANYIFIYIYNLKMFKQESGPILIKKESGPIGNILVGVKDVFLLGSPLILSLLKPRDVEVFWNKTKCLVQTGEVP